MKRLIVFSLLLATSLAYAHPSYEPHIHELSESAWFDRETLLSLAYIALLVLTASVITLLPKKK